MTTENTVEQTASAPAPVENAAPTPADEGKAPESGTTDTPASAAADTDKGEDKTKPAPGVQKRINELTRDKYQLREEKKALEEELNKLRLQNQPQEPVKPKLADFGSDAEYESALDQYHARKQAFDSTQASNKQTQEQATQRKQTEQAQAAQKFVTDLQREKANYQGIDEVMADPAFAAITRQMDPEIVTLIQGSDKNIALAFHLGTNLEVAEKLATLPIVQAAREVALLESRLELPKPKTVTNAPPPVKPVSGSSVKETDLYDPKTSYKDYDAKRKQQRAERRNRR